MKNINLLSIVILLVFIGLTIGCKRPSLESRILEINKFDTCYTFKDSNNKLMSVSRRIQITRNTINDTISIGYSILPPRYTGELIYTREGVLLLYDGTEVENMPKTDSICFENYKGRKPTGSISIQFYN
jgi:hypothetical protein